MTDRSAPLVPHAARSLVIAWVVLIVLLLASWGASFLGLGPWAPVVNLGIAALKTIVVAWIFMHLSESSPLVRITAMTALVFLGILFYIGLMDYLHR